ncbi:MarR family transcriptional regulator [Sphingomonas sp. BGYR3]|uniref:MarR family winged helix-turn-helix transcriptional regulator n=1 Tax=Sphingomonas sp. BGYR3 TaxID=2975483 RepID=UPI0021A54D62|nr:MarR family transcriptional regulator [Sphingomonas sp. BGYR3]MDG5488334.1 MarR family transcriptional regulator [Sphingomonas sp. BGYR3]
MTETPPANPLDQLFCFSVHSTAMAVTRAYKPLLDSLGVTYPQYLALLLLGARDGQSVGELGDQLFLESNTLTPMIKRMEASGLVARRRDDRDERVVRVTLTDAGRTLLAEAQRIASAMLAACGGDLSTLLRSRDDLLAVRRRLMAGQPG